MSLNDCRECKFVCSLSYSDWVPVSQSHYCRPQILWVLKHGYWPDKESASIDTHEDVQKSTPQCSPFEGDLNEMAEIMVRLGVFDNPVDTETRSMSAWPDGVTLKEEIEKQMYEVMQGERKYEKVEPLSTAAWRALGYAGCGPKRRTETYSHWQNRKYGNKKGIILPIKK